MYSKKRGFNMKRIVFLLVCIILCSIFVCACSVKPQKSTINYQRRQTETPHPTQTIDLSEGPRLKYDANLGPQDVNFDFKIKNPY